MKKYLSRLASWVQNGVNVVGWFRTWQFLIVGGLVVLVLLIVAPVKIGSLLALAARATILGSFAYWAMRLITHRRTHTLIGEDLRNREIVIGLIIMGVCIGAGAGAYG